MVITNGFPKSGNHALVKAVQLLGQKCEVNHIPFADRTDGMNIFIKRDPRNIVCSWLRFNRKAVTAENFIGAFRTFQERSLVDELAAYEGWLSSGDLVVTYEALIASDACLRGIAAYLGTPYIDDAFEALPGLTRTWFPDHSDYSAIWTPEVETMWAAEGGPELLFRWGY